MIRAVVVGLGYFSQFHLAAWHADPRVDLAGVCDPDPQALAAATAQWGAPGAASLADLLDRTEADIVDIVAPPPAHATLIETALAPGRLIICQKPFCQSIAEAEAVIARAEAAGARLIIHENFRFQPWYREVKRFLDDGRMGTVHGARFALRPGDGRGPRAYLDRQPAFQAMPRLLIHETAVHFIDLFRWLLGDIVSVYADLRRLNPVIAGEDAGLLLMEHASGAVSQFDGDRLSDHVGADPRRTMGEFEITGEAGTLSVNGDGGLWFRAFGSQTAQALDTSKPVDTASFGGGCVAALIGHAVSALADGQPLENEAADYLAVMRACEAAYTSAKEGRKIALT